MATTETKTTKIGDVIVHIFDSKTQKLIWRGYDSNSLSGSADKNVKNLQKDLSNIFKHFPPSH